MGTDSSTYVGVYLIVPYKKVTKTTKYYVTESGKKSDSKYCPNTGKEHQLVEKPETKMESPWTEFGEYDSLTEDEMNDLEDDMFWVPQWSESKKETSIFILSESSKYLIIDAEHSSTTDLSKIDIPIILNDFSVEYKKYLDAIKKEYGSVEVKFGVVAYSN